MTRPDLSSDFIRTRIEAVVFALVLFLGFAAGRWVRWESASLAQVGATCAFYAAIEIARLVLRWRAWRRWLAHASPREVLSEIEGRS